MPEKQHQNITNLLFELNQGNNLAYERLLPLVYNELKKISSKYLNDEHRNHTLQTTELVHEAFIKLIGNQKISWQNRAHFFGIAARVMRQILVDYARKRNAVKRGSGNLMSQFDENKWSATNDYPLISNISDEKLVSLDKALKKLETIEEKSGKIVELRFFSGLTLQETADLMQISISSVKRHWNFAKAWLYREMVND